MGGCNVEVNGSNQSGAVDGLDCWFNETGLVGNVTTCAYGYANDTTGNLNVTEFRCVNTGEEQYDNVVPDVLWISPATNGTEAVNKAYGEWNLSVSEDIASCEIEVDGTTQTGTWVNATTSSYCYYNQTGLTGNQTSCAWGYAADAAGNWNRTESYVCRNTNEQQPDVIAPDLVWSGELEANGTATAVNKTYVLWNFTSSESILGCNVEVNGTNQSGAVDGLDCYFNETGLTGNVTRCAWGYANDTSGNLNVTEFRCVNTERQQYDNVVPDVLWISPATNGTEAGNKTN